MERYQVSFCSSSEIGADGSASLQCHRSRRHGQRPGCEALPVRLEWWYRQHGGDGKEEDEDGEC